ncbi:MAG: hypothetical protein RL329_2508 [Bacteroidota bacterium]|jgi:hypothetical protein
MLKINGFALLFAIALATAPLKTYIKNIDSINNTVTDRKTDITGYWEGTITQDYPGGKRVDYAMEVDFVQKGKTITGIATVHHLQYGAKMSVEGKGKGNYFRFEEGKIIKYDQLPQAEWCFKKYELIYRHTGSEETLEGLWEGKSSFGDCDPGRILLKKRPPRV